MDFGGCSSAHYRHTQREVHVKAIQNMATCKPRREALDKTYPAAAAKLLQQCPTLRPHRRQPIRLLCPLDSLGKNTGVGCHFLLQCMKVKSESEVTQSCPTLSDPMDCSLPGSSIHGIFQARVLEWGAIAFSETNPSNTLILDFQPQDWENKVHIVCGTLLWQPQQTNTGRQSILSKIMSR